MPKISTLTRLGRSDVFVTALSLGGGPIGNVFSPVDEMQARETIVTAWESGIRYFDTAPFYGLGLSETRLGAALRSHPRSEYVVSTKVGRLLEPEGGPQAWHWDFTRDGVSRSIEASLERMQLDHVDLVLIHDPDDHWVPAINDAYPALHELRSEGVVRAVGVGMNDASMLTRFVTECELDCVLSAGRCTLLDRSAEEELLPLCTERGVSVIAAGVFNSGLLATPDAPKATYNYQPAPPEARQRAQELAAISRAVGTDLISAALQFPSRHPGVASVLVGFRSPDEVRRDSAMFEEDLPPTLWRALVGRGTSEPAGR